jgi:hypothetical protein
VEEGTAYVASLEAEEKRKIIWFRNISFWIVAKDLKFFDRHGLSLLPFPVCGSSF